MITSSKHNEHPACSCRMCMLGRKTERGQFIHKQVARRLRRMFKQQLRKLLVGGDLESVVLVQIGTPYTD